MTAPEDIERILARTRATYDHIAAHYAAARRRREMLRPFTERFVALLPPGALVLDVGAGPGFDTAVLQAHHLRAIGLDLSLPMLQAGRHQLGIDAPLLQADMRHLPFAGVVDGIWACASLLHLPPTAVAPTLREWRRVLRPNGVLYLSVQRGSGARWQPTAYGHPRPRFFTYWQPAALDAALVEAGFILVDAWESGAAPTVWLNRLARRDWSRGQAANLG